MLGRIYEKYLSIKTKRMIKKMGEHISIGRTTIVKPGFQVVRNETIEKLSVNIGKSAIIWGRGSRIFLQNKDAYVEIGDNCNIGPGCSFDCASQIILKDHVLVSWNVVFDTHDAHSLNVNERVKDMEVQFAKESGNLHNCKRDWEQIANQPILIERNVWIGFDAVILKGVKIGEGAVVGARSVVTHDVAPYTLVAGNPARFIKNLKVINSN